MEAFPATKLAGLLPSADSAIIVLQDCTAGLGTISAFDSLQGQQHTSMATCHRV